MTGDHIQRTAASVTLPTVEQVLVACCGLHTSHPIHDRCFRRQTKGMFVSVRVSEIDRLSSNADDFLWILIDRGPQPGHFFAFPHSVVAPLLTDAAQQPWFRAKTKEFIENRWCIRIDDYDSRYFLCHQQVGRVRRLPSDCESRRIEITEYRNRTELVAPIMRQCGLWE